MVTEIDHKIERQFRTYIAKKFPGHKIIGEEFGTCRPEKNDLVWIIDPIDGTTNFIQGLPFCCISIALWDNRGPLVGVVYNPILEELYTASRDHGSFLNGKRLAVSSVSKFSRAYGGFGWGRDIGIAVKSFPLIIKNTKKIRTLGNAAWETCLVAKGVYDFQIQKKICIWDFAAAACILQEAGGKITDEKGQKISLRTNTLICSNGKLHKEILKKISPP